jgi:hypothetical protein
MCNCDYQEAIVVVLKNDLERKSSYAATSMIRIDERKSLRIDRDIFDGEIDCNQKVSTYLKVSLSVPISRVLKFGGCLRVKLNPHR